MILVTGAAGPTGLAVLRALARRGAAARALVRGMASARRVREAGAVEVAVGDLGRDGDVRAAMAGVRRVYHIGPAMSDDEIGIGGRLVAAALAAGVEQFAFHSVVHAQCDALPHHRDKRRVEEMLVESALPYTLMKPTMYMQNLEREWDTVVRDGVYRLPYSEHARMGLVDLEDVAEAAATMLTQDGWVGGEFELASGDVLSRVQMAEAIGDVLGRPVRAERGSLEAWRPVAARTRTPFQVDRVATMYAHYDRHGLGGGNARVLAMILRRPPTAFRDYVARLVAQRAGATVPA
ncbi:MAG: NmrA family NAD(P)-binding protein [Rubrivivax sp.]|nr:NmrA family NAD(P)-binding protein [Rubrivivax sp.]